METTDAILQMLQQRTQQGPTLINNYESALSTAAGQDQQSIDQFRGIYSDPSKFERSKLTSFGLGLMAPTANGRLNESMFNGLAAAVETQNLNQERNLSREEKLAGLAALEAKLTRQKAEDTMSVYDKQTGYITNSLQDRTTMADLQLDKNLPGGPRKLAPGEEGPPAPDPTPFNRAMSIYNDYNTNPSKYAGPQGQAMVKNAIDLINAERNSQTRLQVAEARTEARRRPTITTKDKTIIDDAVTQNNQLKQTLLNLEEAEKIGPKTWSGIMPNERARVTSWWYGNEGQDSTTADEHLRYQQIMEGEAIAQMSSVLKGATTDREMQKFIDIVADPSVPWNSTKKHALAQVKRFAQSVIDMNDEKVRGIQDGSYWTGEQSSDQPQTGDYPDDPNEVIGRDANGQDITWGDIQTTAEENGMTVEQVLERLKGGN